GFQGVVLNAAQSGRTEQLVQCHALDAKDALVQWEIGGAGVGPPMVPALDRQPAQQLGGELEWLVAEDMVLQEFQGLTLLAPGYRYQRIARLEIALVVAVRVLATNVLGDQVGAVTVLRQQDAEGHAGPLVALAVVHHARREPLEQVFRQEHTVLSEL